MFQIKIDGSLYNTTPSIRSAESEAAALIKAGREGVTILWVPTDLKAVQ